MRRFWHSPPRWRLHRVRASSSGVVGRRTPERGRRRGPETTVHPYGVVGSVLVLGSVMAWCLVVLAARGLNGFFASYRRVPSDDIGIRHAARDHCTGAGVRFVLAVTGRTGWPRTSAIVAFLCFAVVALPIGLRTEVMFPAVAAIVALARCGGPSRGSRPAPWWWRSCC